MRTVHACRGERACTLRAGGGVRKRGRLEAWVGEGAWPQRAGVGIKIRGWSVDEGVGLCGVIGFWGMVIWGGCGALRCGYWGGDLDGGGRA